MNTYYTQQGVTQGLRDLIAANVPKAVISELKDRHFGFEAVSPLELLQHIEGEAEPIDIIGQNELMEARDTPIDFEGETSLKEFFKQIDKTIKQLDDDHDIDTSHKSLMAKYLLQIEQEGGGASSGTTSSHGGRDPRTTRHGKTSRKRGSKPTRRGGQTTSSARARASSGSRQTTWRISRRQWRPCSRRE